MPTSATYLGTVQDVQGATISIALDQNTVSGLAFIEGVGYRIGQVGSLVRIPIGFTDLFGIVAQAGAGAVPASWLQAEPYGHRWLRVQLIGEAHRSGEFRRGISQFPTIGDEAHLVSDQDLVRVYGRPNEPCYVRVGSLASSESIPALLEINRLIAHHSAVVGATGSGKSTTVANLLASLSEPDAYPSARMIIVDIHGEYYSALRDRATVFKVNADEESGEKPLLVPYWALSFDELLCITPFHGLGDAERGAVIEKVRELKTASLRATPRSGATLDTITVDTPIPFSIHRLWYELHRYVCSTHTAPSANQSSATEAIETGPEGTPLLGDIMQVIPPTYRPITQGGQDRVYLSAAPLNMRRQIIALEKRLRDTRYAFLFRPGPWCPEPTLQDLDAQPQQDLDTFLASWIGGDRPITVLDLSGVPVSILVDLVGVVLRLLFDALFWARHLPEGGRQQPLLCVLEEAHSYLSPGNEGLAANAARRLVKEGRKYGLGAMIVSQRPAEIDPTLLSQCGTLFALRLANSLDRSHVMSTASDHLEGLFSMLPALRTGEAIVVGEAVHLPLRVLIDEPANKRYPDSNDPKVYDPQAKTGWNRQKQIADYARVLEKWRSENPKEI